MTDEQLRGMAQACVTDIETCRSFSDQDIALQTHLTPIQHAITELRTGITQQQYNLCRWLNSNAMTTEEWGRVQMYRVTMLAVLREVPTSPAALVGYLKSNVLTPAQEAA